MGQIPQGGPCVGQLPGAFVNHSNQSESGSLRLRMARSHYDNHCLARRAAGVVRSRAMKQTPSHPLARLGALALPALLAAAAPASALDACKARIEPATGLIQVSAAKVSGTLTWSGSAGAAGRPFFDPTCVKNGKAVKCLLAAPSTLAARTPPSECTLQLADGASSCTPWVQGCVPGSRAALDLAASIVGTWTLHQGGTITFGADGTFSTSELTTGTYRVVGESVLLDIDSIPGELNQVLTYLGTTAEGQLVFAQETPLGLTPAP